MLILKNRNLQLQFYAKKDDENSRDTVCGLFCGSQQVAYCGGHSKIE